MVKPTDEGKILVTIDHIKVQANQLFTVGVATLLGANWMHHIQPKV